MAGAADWLAKRINDFGGLDLVERLDGDLLLVRGEAAGEFPIAVTGVSDVVLTNHISPVLEGATKPQFIVNVPSKAIWSGPAIGLVHSTPAAYGTLSELAKAARTEDVPAYRNKERAFFERAIMQHDNVRSVTPVYDHVFGVTRRRGDALTVVLVDAYNMSAEDVRHACTLYGRFDIAVKMSSYGAVTAAAIEAAKATGAEALTFRQLMGRLAR